eukprot:TRINITY_DN7004_c0_g1_i1.p2 TRINITY_DN7004_c0_g1~~TRINITY_DN7004_c0_g1_i1.p2  ORF type:complete len:798 (+),score=332.78 TRINITY_DN7004_c0_g1_i1:394-2787(+)
MLRRCAAKGGALTAARRGVANTSSLFRAPHVREVPVRGELGGPSEVYDSSAPISLEERKAVDVLPHIQEHENDKAAFVLLHVPGQEIVMGSYHPCGALFECTISLNRARDCITRLRELLASQGIPVRSLGEVMRMGHFSEDRERLKTMASNSLMYSVLEKDEPNLQGEELRLTSEEYKNDVVGGLDVRDLVDVIVTQPTVYLAKSGNNTPLKSTGYRFEPLSNLIFTRDQMIVTARGAVLANLNSAQRGPEVKVVEFCLKKLGIEVIGHIEPPGTLEGGDFFPAGRDLCFIGMGIRTNDAAIQHMMKKDMFGTRRVAVVADLFDRNQARMHLDCVANIASDSCFVVRESILGRLNPKRRVVTEYTKNDHGKYEISIDGMEFGEYLELNGWHVIPASEQMADDLGINFINMGDGQLICTDEAMAETIEGFPHFEGKVHVLDYREICKMYGAIHCTTQVFRKARPDADQPSTGVLPVHTAPALIDTTKVHHIPDEKDQTTNNVLLVAPTQFGQNNETLEDNDFMTRDKKFARHTDIDIITAACEEFEGLYSSLLREGVAIKLYHHEPYHGTPDACFPNNWFSTHKTSTGVDLVLYPMAHPSRRRERRPDIMNFLRPRSECIIDLTDAEDDGKFLEGTGSMVLDRTHRIAYAVVSSRTNKDVLADFCKELGYKAHMLYTQDNMYHTNVMMSIGTSYAVVCFEHLKDPEAATELYKTLKSTGKTIVPISKDQCANMCGNVLELRGATESFIAMSDRAYRAYRPEQLYTLLQTVDHIVHPPYNTIETLAGGSIRCSIAELFL